MKAFGAIAKDVGGNEGDKCRYSTRLDTYGCGCQHDCSYCYAKSLLFFRKLWNAENPSVADIDKIRRQIAKQKKGDIVRLGGMTDCFQPCELIHRNTYKTLKSLNKRGVGYLVVTKSNIVARDEYMAVYDRNLAHFQITVTTLDDQLSRTYEKAIVEFLRVNSWIQQWFKIDYSKYTVSQSGYHHLPLSEKRRIIEKIHIPSISVCEDVTDHYEYWKNSFNPNQEDCCNLRRAE